MNDPNGLVYADGEYHLFYQHHPEDTVWGPMHWGHAVSPDLLNWTHLPIALYPDEIGAIFSGSAVVDEANTAGFGAGAMVAIFTHATNERQTQSLAYSTDRGRTWTKYEGDPILEPPDNVRDFRDPKVFWYGGLENGHWVMLVAAGNVILHYISDNLTEWEPTSSFGPCGAIGNFWETPDLFELPVDGGPETRWLLAVAIDGPVPVGQSGVQYFVGDFDGQTFTSENPTDTILWVDHGADFFAAQGWNDAPDGRAVWIAYMNDWEYAQTVPTSTWRGAFTLPRELSLTETRAGIRLVQQPVREVEHLRGESWAWETVTIDGASDLLAEVSGEALEIIARIRVDQAGAVERVGLRVRVGDNEHTTVGYEIRSGTLYVDRATSGKVDFSPGFPGIHAAPMAPLDGQVTLHLFVDRSSVEVFGNGGRVVLTELVFPSADSLGVELFAAGGPVQVAHLQIYRLTPATFRVLMPPPPEE